MSKRKGSNAERALLKMFWNKGWAAVRVAGSGSMHYPSSDIVAGNRIRRLAIEVKTTKDNKKYFPAEEIQQLINFSQYFGAEPWLAIKFPSKWVFLVPEDLDNTKTGYVCCDDSSKALSFEDLVGE